MEETPFRFGAGNGLVGVLTSPSGACVASTAALLFNAGVLHRVGPHRLNVKLARALAAHGIPVLRMDLSGLGDSLPPRDGLSYRDQTMSDLRAGIDLIGRETGVERCLSIGICSGAFNGFALALDDRRVVGLFMLDGYAYPTLRTLVRLRWGQLRRTPIVSVPGAALRVTMQLAAQIARHDELEGTGPPSLSRAEFKDGLERLTGRGVAVFLAYSGSLTGQYNYPTQLADVFGDARFLGDVRHAYLPHLDHTLTTLEAQREFIRLVCDWAAQIAADKKFRPTLESTTDILGSGVGA